jgi:hypothetical protein
MPLFLNCRSSLAALAQTARFPFIDATARCVRRIIESRFFSSKAVPHNCAAHAADGGRSGRHAHFAEKEIVSSSSVHSN